jgi:DNA-binding NtrC family response regulator
MPTDLGCVAIVDDDPIMGESLQRALELEGWRAVWWHTGQNAVDGMFEVCPDLVLCDIRLPDMDGDEIFRTANARSLAPPFIFMTAFGQIDQAVALVRAGAQDYLTKPFEVANLFQKVREVLSLRVHDGGDGALGTSKSMRGIEALLKRLAPRSLPILFTGETGTGKEVCARFLHEVSPAATQPFMAVNCAAIPSDLLKVNCSDTTGGRFLERISVIWDMQSAREAGSSFSMRSPRCPFHCKRKCCGCSKSVPFIGWGARVPFR